MILPDYHGGSIVNLMSSITLGLDGGQGLYAPLTLLPPATVANAAHVVLLVLDGLGYHYLRTHGKSLNAYMRGPITSVFPTSTAPAVTTFLTGVAPQQHGVTGWFMHLKELGTIAVVLPFRPRWGNASFTAAGYAVDDFITAPPVFNSLPVPCYFIIHQDLADSPYSKAGAGRAERVGYRNLAEYLSAIQTLVTQGPERSYIYAYWPLFDALSHLHGVGSHAVLQHLQELEEGFETLVMALEGTSTLVIATADHGFIDTEPRFKTKLEDHPGLANCLALPLCGEPRVAYCHVHPGKAARFERYANDYLGDGFDWYPSEELLHQGWFGLGEPDPCVRERIGDYVLVGKDRHVIKDSLPREGFWSDIGVHGGMSEDEMYVPLLIAQC